MNICKNKNYINKINEQLSKKVQMLEKEDFQYFAVLTDELIKERTSKFGKNPNFESMSIREKIYPGMYFINLMITDMLTTHRYEYWTDVLYTKDLSKDIPYINFNNSIQETGKEVYEMLRNCIDINYVGKSRSFINFVKYLLYSLKPINHFDGNTIAEKEKEAEKLIAGISDEALKHYYENFSLEALLLYPGDYLGNLAADYLGSNGSAYFPTPENIVQFMVEVLKGDKKDMKLSKVCDPCTGSSRMLLYASNYSLNLFGSDVNEDIINVSLVNGYLYVPWVVHMPDNIYKIINKDPNIKAININDREAFKFAANGQLTFL